MAILGHVVHGSGARRVIVLHDWMGDHRNYDPVLPYLDRAAFTYAFADLRGYGLSREVEGRYDLAEAAGDVLALGAALGWDRFALVGHSMSTLVAQQVAATAPAKVGALVLVTPVSPRGMGAPDEVIAMLEAGAATDEARRRMLGAMWGERLSPGWLDFKLARWAESATPAAARAYVRMFSASSLTAPPADVPILAILGAHDAPHFQEPAIRAALAVYPRLSISTCADAGHYPMQESPPLFAARLERFLSRG